MIRHLLAATFALGLASCSDSKPPPKAPDQKAPEAAVEVFTPIAAPASATPTVEDPALARLRKEYAAGAISVVQFNAATLTSATAGAARTLNVAPSVTLQSVTREVSAPEEGRVTWTGDIAAGGSLPAGNATIVVEGTKATGTISAPDGRRYQVRPLDNGGTAIIQMDFGKLPPEEPQGGGNHVAPGPQPSADATPAAAPGAAVLAATPTVDLLVAYTPAAATASGGIDSLITLATQETNQGFVNSKVRARVRVAGKMSVNLTEGGKTFDQILAAFVANPTVATKRNAVKADVAVLIINKTDYCGLADAIKATAATAYVIVHYGCATGYFSYGHEIGHLLGARHDETTDPTTTPYPYGHGFRHTGANPFRTIMGYACGGGGPCDPRIDYWSNPDVKYNGIAIGTVAKNNNARVWNERAATVAAFR